MTQSYGLGAKCPARVTPNAQVTPVYGSFFVCVLLPPIQNKCMIVDARLKMPWSIIITVITGTPTILKSIAW